MSLLTLIQYISSQDYSFVTRFAGWIDFGLKGGSKSKVKSTKSKVLMNCEPAGEQGACCQPCGWNYRTAPRSLNLYHCSLFRETPHCCISSYIHLASSSESYLSTDILISFPSSSLSLLFYPAPLGHFFPFPYSTFFLVVLSPSTFLSTSFIYFYNLFSTVLPCFLLKILPFSLSLLFHLILNPLFIPSFISFFLFLTFLSFSPTPFSYLSSLSLSHASSTLFLTLFTVCSSFAPPLLYPSSI